MNFFKNYRIFSLILIFIGLVQLSAAQNSPSYDSEPDKVTFADFDTDGNEFIDEDEFEVTFTSEFHTDFGSEDDESLDDEDFYGFIYAYIDTSGNELVSKKEWKIIDQLFFANFLFKKFDFYDTDDDNYLSFDEYIEAIYDVEGFDKWDINRDGFVDQNELAEAVFKSWDVDNNGVINRSEYSHIEKYFEDLEG
ncbi:MAG: hypothetical protein R3277_09680 [Brumimicrobium sp.]|nr:hypothetical protein [Brumimicrobium sp.]